MANHVLAAVRALQTVFAQAIGVPSTWLEITVAEDTTMAVKAASGQTLYVMLVELAPEHFSNERFATIREIMGDGERLNNLLTTALPMISPPIC